MLNVRSAGTIVKRFGSYFLSRLFAGNVALTVTSDAMAGPQRMCVICSRFLGSSYTRLSRIEPHMAKAMGGG